MTHVSRTGFAFRMLAGLAIIAGLMSLASKSVPAAKPPTTIPAGTIYFSTIDSQFWGMKADGSGKFEALPKEALLDLNRLSNGSTPVPWAYPSNQPSGERWWITTAITGTYDSITYNSTYTATDQPHYDLVAVRRSHADPTQLDVVQLTDFFGIVVMNIQSAFWSNDSNDAESSFAGFEAHDIRSTYVPITNSATLVGVPYVVPRLPVTVSEIAAGNFVPYDDTLTDEEIDDLLWPGISGISLEQGSTNPAGNLSVAVASKRLMIVDVAAPDYNNPLQLLWDGNGTQMPQSFYFPAWSPDGLTIVFSATGSNGTVFGGIGEGDLWTVPADGSAPPKKVLASSKKGQTTKLYRLPVWSPDSKYLVVQEVTLWGTTVTNRGPVRIPATGGTPLDLGVVDKSGMAFRWVPKD